MTQPTFTSNPSDPLPHTIAVEYLSSSKLMQVSTFAGRKVGFAHAWFAFDKALNFYFASNIIRAHSDNIRESGVVGFGVVSIPLVGLGQKVQGITGHGTGKELEGTDLEGGFAIYSARWPKAAEAFPISEMLNGRSPMRIYRIVPHELVLWDEVNYPAAPRQVVVP